VSRVATGRSLTLRAVVASRLLVLVAGAAGVLLVSRRAGWQAFDPGGIATHLGALGNLLAGSTLRSDGIHYLTIALHGYAAAGPGARAFYPLFPWLMRDLGFVVGSDFLAGIVISLASFAGALVLLHRLTELELGPRAADATVLILAFAPLSFFFSAVYTESLFLLLSVATIYVAREERWALAALLGGLAALTRSTGVLLCVPIVIMIFKAHRLDRRLAWALLVPGMLLAYLASLAASGSSWLAPFQAEKVWHALNVGPLGGIALGVRAAIASLGAVVRGAQPVYDPTRFGPLTPYAESILLLAVLVGATIVLVSCFRRLPLQYGAYAALALLMCVSSPKSGEPLQSLDRYVLTIFPLWMAAGAWLAERRLTRPVVLAGGCALAFYTLWFASFAFIA
jgi:Dolichyl-phosphate-mannose-protein mannosyltransferase